MGILGACLTTEGEDRCGGMFALQCPYDYNSAARPSTQQPNEQTTAATTTSQYGLEPEESAQQAVGVCFTVGF